MLALLADTKGGISMRQSEGLNYVKPETEKFTHFRNDPRNQTSLSDNHKLTIFKNSIDTLVDYETEEDKWTRFECGK